MIFVEKGVEKNSDDFILIRIKSQVIHRVKITIQLYIHVGMPLNCEVYM